MSLILEALRKSEAEREIGRVPGLRSQTLPLDDPLPAARDGATLPAWGWVTIGGLAALLAVAVAWGLWGGRPAAPRLEATAPVDVSPRAPSLAAAPVAPAAPAAPTAPPPAPTPSTAAAADPALPLRWGAEDRARPPSLPAPPRTAAARAPVVARAPLTSPATTRAAGPGAPSAAPRAPAAAPAIPSAAVPVTAGAPLPTYEQLPDDVRRRVPPVTVEGSAYSADAASRMLIVNGQVVREGDALANGLVLETIQLRSAVLRAGEVRYRISY
jgi:general secretion pathway protein B